MHEFVLFRTGQREVELGSVEFVGPVVVQEVEAALEHLGLLLQKTLKRSALLPQTYCKLILVHFNPSFIINVFGIIKIVGMRNSLKIVEGVLQRQVCKIDGIRILVLVDTKHLQLV